MGQSHSGLTRAVVELPGDQRGAVAFIFALVLPVLIGFLALVVEGSSWYVSSRSMQNAADEAAIAAATNGTSTYDREARAVAALYGYTNGVGNVTVAASNTATCPTGGNTCYSVTINRKLPLIFSPVVGFIGNTVIGTSRAELIASAAVAKQDLSPRDYCILALGTSGASPAFRTNGAPSAALAGCNVMSNTNMTCNGHDTGATYGDAAGTNNGCGVNKQSGVPTVSDPYVGRASAIPANPCSTYPQAPSKKKDPDLPATNLLTGSLSFATKTICGDAQLSGNVTLTGANSVLVVRNGQLDTNGFTIKTASGASATIVFSGPDSAGAYTHAPTGGGTLDITAPTSGPWSGIAMYQDPVLTGGVDITAAGNSPTWNITGLVYLPHASVTFSGAVNKSSNGASCFGLVVDNILINGTASILAQGGCGAAGLTLPSNPFPGRGRLVA